MIDHCREKKHIKGLIDQPDRKPLCRSPGSGRYATVETYHTQAKKQKKAEDDRRTKKKMITGSPDWSGRSRISIWKKLQGHMNASIR